MLPWHHHGVSPGAGMMDKHPHQRSREEEEGGKQDAEGKGMQA